MLPSILNLKENRKVEGENGYMATWSDYQNMDEKYLKKRTVDGDIETKIYPFEALS